MNTAAPAAAATAKLPVAAPAALFLGALAALEVELSLLWSWPEWSCPSCSLCMVVLLLVLFVALASLAAGAPCMLWPSCSHSLPLPSKALVQLVVGGPAVTMSQQERIAAEQGQAGR